MTRQISGDQMTITATEMRRDFRAVVRRLRKRREHAIIESKGAPVAVLLSVAEYEQLLRYKRLMIMEN